MKMNRLKYLFYFLCMALSVTGIAQNIIEQAWELERAGRNEEAFKLFQEAVKEFPDTSRVWKGRADVGFKLYSDTDAAISDYTRAISLKPTAVYAFEGRGFLKYMKKDYYGSMSDFSKAITLKPDYDRAYNARAYCKLALLQYRDAIQDYNTAINLDPTLAGAYLGRGDAERELGQYDAAMDDFNKAVGLNPRFKNAYNDRISDSAFNGMDKVSIIKMQSFHGVYKIPAQVNGIDVDFIFDTGASTVSISDDEANTLKKLGKLSDADILGDTQMSIANGTLCQGTVIVLRAIRIGNKVLYNVPATITHGTNAPLLLGQSVLGKFGKVSIDYNRGEITFQ